MKKLHESILDPIKNELNKDLFSNDKLKDSVKKQLLSTLYVWKDKFLPDVEIDSIVLLGSSAGYQYTTDSDIDINVTLKGFSKSVVKEVLPFLPNGNMLPGTNHPINYYLAPDRTPIEQADNAYDLLKDKWIKYPTKVDIDVPYSYAIDIAKFFMFGIDNAIREYESDKREVDYYKRVLSSTEKVDKDDIQKRISIKKEEILADLDSIYIAHKLLRSFRQEAFSGDYESDLLISISTVKPNFSINNIVYKQLEANGYLDKLLKYEKLRDKLKEDFKMKKLEKYVSIFKK